MFWRETGIKDEEDEVEAREGACSIETAMMVESRRRGETTATKWAAGRGQGRQAQWALWGVL